MFVCFFKKKKNDFYFYFIFGNIKQLCDRSLNMFMEFNFKYCNAF